MLPAITDVEAYVRTREGWHTLAERVLAPALHAATGRIGLRVDEAGITTPPFGDDARRLRVRVGTLEDHRASGGRGTALTTLGDAATFAGVDLATDTGVYTATTPSDPTTWVAGDRPSATALVAWFAFGDAVLTRWRDRNADESPATIQLWPEHFDLGTDLGPDDARRANFGASPGDSDHPLPYLYVGPWNASDDPFWNAGSYARLSYAELATSDDPHAVAADFFQRGHAVATRANS
jgi:hypothetical protein